MVLLLSIPPSLFYLIKIFLEAILVFFVLEMAGNSNKNADIDSSFTSVPATQELFSSPEPDDIFLTVQRSTFAVGKIYNDLLQTQDQTLYQNCLSYAVLLNFGTYVTWFSV